MGTVNRDLMARRIADCLEIHLHDFGWEPYRYPSGEHKGIDFDQATGRISLLGSDRCAFTLDVMSRPSDVPLSARLGDFIVIGPECFALRDGSVLSWRGENYVPQRPTLRVRLHNRVVRWRNRLDALREEQA